MAQRWLRTNAARLVGAFGTALFLLAVGHHATEFSTHDGMGPILAVVLDGAPALGLVFVGYRLSDSDLSTDGRWTVWLWCLAGAVLIGAVMGATVLVRTLEGRTIAEPVFPLLVAVEAGAIAGSVAGYYNARARADARQAERVTDAFVFVNTLIRHDLRNDLNVIQGYADSMATAPEPDADDPTVILEKTAEALTRIETTEAIADVLIGDPDFEPIDLAAITAEMATRVDETFEVDVTTDLPERACVTANPGLRSVVDNVLENAAEHNDADEPRIHVEVTVASETVRLSVRDNGPGIPDARKGAIFETSADGSTGGLSLVGTLIDGYGGTARIEDNDPRGTVFVVELPRATDPNSNDDPVDAVETARSRAAG
ncbi:ATP-binding protein [Natrinema longum]|uniref:histidine kinase n=1 Tax=Natrinema longum TaxID=370324 RepID=A0A8A2U860_9EURY|nr:ATP-binding protein [Natrinema longum]MBZ6493819.1 histidine kinase [Natrinema longum]QSW84844.1 histidine kinase [Natrinema longum]